MKMSLNYLAERVKAHADELYMSTVIILIGLMGFGLGRLSKLEDQKAPITVRGPAIVTGAIPNSNILGKFVASKTGSSYYLPWCAGVKRIKEANKVWFDTEEEAISAGYRKANNCRGL